MNGSRSRSQVMLYSLSEFAFILLFLSVGAGALLYARWSAAEQQAAEFHSQIAALSEEVDFLNEILAEKRYGVVPCWRRPDSAIPTLVGTVTIHGSGAFSVQRTHDQQTLDIGPAEQQTGDGASGDGEPLLIRQAVRGLFTAELDYAAAKNCYLRLVIDNQTDSYAHYRGLASLVSGTHMVVVNE